MQNPNIVFIGMDTHKGHSSISYLLDGYGYEPVYFGQIKSTKTALQKLVRQLQSKFPKCHTAFCSRSRYVELNAQMVDIIFSTVYPYSKRCRAKIQYINSTDRAVH